MLQPSKEQFSDEDYRLIEVYHLGNPLCAYQLKPGYIFILRLGSLIFQIMAFALVIGTISTEYRLLVAQTTSVFIIVNISMIFAVFVLECFSLISLPNEQKMHLIVCEKGLFQVKKLLRNNCVEVVYWEEVAGIKRGIVSILEYQIIRRGKKEAFTLFSGYHHYGELIDLIREQSRESEI